jgi:5S rRNA maturation endonuclease (ribonuclease M5)
LFGDRAASQNYQVKYLSTKLKDKEEKIQQVIAKLIEESAMDKPIVVEGKKDKVAIQEMGIKGKIITLKTGGKSFLRITEEIEKLGVNEVILLLDFDRRGKEGMLRLKHDLERVLIKPNMKFWFDFQALVGQDIACIESLPSYLNTLQERFV